MSRRFLQARVRLLLLKQDRISIVEDRLKAVDDAESKALYLGSSRADANTERQELLSDLDRHLADYGGCILTPFLCVATREKHNKISS